MTQKIGVVIVAAGSGSRFGDPLPKQYHQLGGKSLLAHCVDCFVGHTSADLIQIVYNPIHQDWYDDVMSEVACKADIPMPVNGGQPASNPF